MEQINGYTLDGPLKNDNSGMSKWGFAHKNGCAYFIKEFLSPVYPLDTVELSASTLAHRRAICDGFERAKAQLYKRINYASRGSLVRVDEFFRAGSRYYIVTEKVETDERASQNPSALTLSERITLCQCIAFAFHCLHQGGVVHSDVKPGNILLYRLPNGRCAAKVIDFDCSFLVESPPKDGDELGCDVLYLAPEGLLLLQGEDVTLGPEIDVFSLGLVFHEYLTGHLPEFDAEAYGYPCGAALAGMLEPDLGSPQELLKVDASLPPQMRELLERMLEPDPEKRLTMAQVITALAKIADTPVTPEPPIPPNPDPPAPPDPDLPPWFHRPDDL